MLYPAWLPPRGIESAMKHEAEEVYRVDVVPIGEAQPEGATGLR
jgi:hypothetical protein